ncbi:Intracellular protein transport protein USO1 [Apiospora arundinis]|uniref:Intracellular protein transport protein USO1 n=1 Tax=Apiospora arundinis TaxID=335852 RepID=A0ABR2IG29_9PEZI
MFSSIATAPAKQSVGETITILSGRLSSATLLEDRRAAILGLRSFAKEYPASVASGALRSLIGSLSKDGEDVDTVKVVLETLLMLFNPNQDSPEASEEIALWLADEFTQRQENVTLLLDFLETTDFYSRLYSLQLLSAILSARTERTEECILKAVPGISRLVAVLDERREAVRNEALSLLTYLTPANPEIQKVVAFEDAFERIFAIIAAEGGLVEGDRVVEDCLILLANLLRLNAFNQSSFRETGHVPQLSRLLESSYQRPKEAEEMASWAQQQGNRNIYALLAVIRLFLVQGAVGTLQNQTAFWQHGVLYHALQLAFTQTAELLIRAEALSTCADIIKANPKLQESFAQLQVPSVLEDAVPMNGQNGNTNGPVVVYVIDGLLDLTLSVTALQAFDLRLAACQCIKAYFFHHPEIRLHFLRRAIDGHTSGRDETANVLTTLLQPSSQVTSNDPYRHWFASVILLHLVYDNTEAKALAMSVTEGDAESGEEVVTSIQTITAHLISGLARKNSERTVDERITVGYLMLLLGWLFEDLDGVNDFLGEGSNIQSIAQAVDQAPNGSLVQGLCAMLLGVCYEFSTKDSPISRSRLHDVLLQGMTREKYIDVLTKLRSHPFIRDFEVMPQKLDNSGNLPEVFFDATFVDFFKDNYSRILRGIDREPGMEISVVTNGVQKGISRELVDSLRAQLEEKERALQSALADMTSFDQRLGQEQADHRRSKESSASELTRLKAINEALQRSREEEIQQIKSQLKAQEDAHQKQLETVRREVQKVTDKIHEEHRVKEEELQRQLEYVKKTAEAATARAQRRAESELAEAKKKAEAELAEARKKAETEIAEVKKTADAQTTRAQRLAEADMADLRATISRFETDLMKANKAKVEELRSAQDEHAATLKTAQEAHTSKLSAETARATAAAAKAKTAEDRINELQKQIAEFEKRIAQKEGESKKAQSQLKSKDEEKAAVQTELDDLLMVFGDLEEKVEKYKKRLKGLGEIVSDGEGDDEDDDDEEEEDDDDNEVD